MFDGGKIITGLIIGLGLLLFPFFYNAGTAAKAPVRELTPEAKKAKVCVEDKAFMVASHFTLLDEWRNTVVRDEERYYKGSDGKVYYKSLQVTCMECHWNKTKFCDQCHNYLQVVPFCWDCHIEPKEKK